MNLRDEYDPRDNYESEDSISVFPSTNLLEVVSSLDIDYHVLYPQRNPFHGIPGLIAGWGKAKMWDFLPSSFFPQNKGQKVTDFRQWNNDGNRVCLKRGNVYPIFHFRQNIHTIATESRKEINFFCNASRMHVRTIINLFDSTFRSRKLTVMSWRWLSWIGIRNVIYRWLCERLSEVHHSNETE